MSVLITLLLMSFQAPQSNQISSVLIGSWIGTLEYRDYSDNSREKLGTLLRVYRDPATNQTVFRYVYDDGPSKVVQDVDRVEIDDSQAKYSIYFPDFAASRRRDSPRISRSLSRFEPLTLRKEALREVY